MDALVASEVAVMGGISKVDWLAEEFVDDGSTDDFEDDQRRRLETYESTPARVRVRVPLSTVSESEASDLSRTIARRVKAAVNGDNVPALKDTLAAVSEPLAAALDVDGTDRSADADTVRACAEITFTRNFDAIDATVANLAQWLIPRRWSSAPRRASRHATRSGYPRLYHAGGCW